MGIAHQRQQGKLQRRTQMTSILPRLCYSSSPVSPKAGTLAHKLPPDSTSIQALAPSQLLSEAQSHDIPGSNLKTAVPGMQL